MKSKASAHWSIFENVRKDLVGLFGFINGIIIDIGCGSAPFRKEIEKIGMSYIGIDIPSQIERSDFLSRSDNIDIFGDCLELPVKNASVDTVFSSFVIEHIFDYQKLFSEAYRVLKKNGHFILVSPLINVLHEEPHDYFRYTNYALERIATKEAFKVVEIKKSGGEILFMGHLIANHLMKTKKRLKADRCCERLSFIIQRLSLILDRRFSSSSFVCNYVSAFKK